MAAYATVDDLVLRWRPLTDEETIVASALIEDAAVMIRSAVPNLESRLADESLSLDVLKLVTVHMVKRSMSAPAGFEGVSQWSPTSGPHSQSLTFANPTGDMWMTKADKKLLGVSGSKAFTVDMFPAYTDEEYAAAWEV